MISENWKEYINNEKNKYKKIRHIECPAFNNEKVYFNYYGLYHILNKHRTIRSKDIIMNKFKLLPYVPNIIKQVKSVDDEEKRMKDKSTAYFWTIKYTINDNLHLRISLRRLNNGTLHFFSVMKE